MDKSRSWKRSTRTSQATYSIAAKTENKVLLRVLSARLHKIKELENELGEVQRTLAGVTSENRLLTYMQDRNSTALQTFENSDNSLQQLLTRHKDEVRTLRGSLKTSKEHERLLSRKLKMTELELLRAKEGLQKLQRLSQEDKKLPEREELKNRLSGLLLKLEIDDNKIKVLEKRSRLAVGLHDRQLASECKKVSETQDITRRLRAQNVFALQKIKAKERELNISNIYANRTSRNLHRRSLGSHKESPLTKGTQTESGVFAQAQSDGHSAGEHHNFTQEENQYMKSISQKIADPSRTNIFNNGPNVEDDMKKSEDISRTERKNNLMKELFGPGYILRSHI